MSTPPTSAASNPFTFFDKTGYCPSKKHMTIEVPIVAMLDVTDNNMAAVLEASNGFRTLDLFEGISPLRTPSRLS